MELWDVYDIHRRKQSYKLARCTQAQLAPGCGYRAALAPSGKLQLEPDEYHLSVHVWFVNSRGELLIQKRAETKVHMPGVWAACGGAVMAGEDSVSAAVRESYEEMSIELDPERLVRLLTYTAPERNSHMDVYLYRYECDPDGLTLQEEEVSRAAWFTLDELTGKTFTDEQFRRYTYMDILYNFIKVQTAWRRAGFVDRGVRGGARELLDVYDVHGERTGQTMLRDAAQPYGDYYRTVHVWFVTSNGRVLLERRAPGSARQPGLLASVQGVVQSGEDPLAAARRQSEEELGLKLDESRLFRLCEFVGDYCMCTVYLANQDVSADELELRKDEVASVDFVSADMLGMFSDSGEFSSAPYVPMVISAMRVIERRHHT